ncbi:divisome protein SepX/GlpR [Actinomadura roseirufa]|uniref:divisome protein SepX/GlpR n=1 Tax=Actinomadura roseirufa TaxID=2094049 RepID=UPI0010412FAD|nr:hypothetical protein [Actinomadura roseirufa]
MSSAVLYLAIVAVWAVVLVPMWLRRDGDAGITRLLKRSDEPAGSDGTLAIDEPAVPGESTPTEEETAETPARSRLRPGRAAVIARRRRRTAGLTLLIFTTVVLAATGVLPWWATVPAAALLTGHLTLLRVAVGVDAANARADAAARAKAQAQARAAEEATEPAEVIELVTPDEVFDQYADDRRAVGE